MTYRTRNKYTAAQKGEMWERWQKGDSLASIARLFDRGHSSVQGILQRSGGIRPPQRTRSMFALTLREREEISRGIVAGHSIRSIAIMLRRAPSTVSREVIEMAVASITELAALTRPLGTERVVQRRVSSHRTKC